MDALAQRERYSRSEVKDIISSVLAKIDRNVEPTARLYDELKKLEDYIENMKAELAQLRSIEITHNNIPAASDELEAVVEETAKATGAIMDSCEHIENVAANLDKEEQEQELQDAVTKIYEACSFQDITGQRISKVVKTLVNIEQKVHDIIEAIGNEAGLQRPDKKEEDESHSLLNGPQLQGGGASQEEIDAILASFD